MDILLYIWIVWSVLWLWFKFLRQFPIPEPKYSTTAKVKYWPFWTQIVSD